MSWPQQTGDLIFPHPFGHFATCTLSLLSVFTVSNTKDELHLLQVNPLTPIPHLAHLHSITSSPVKVNTYYSIEALYGKENKC